MAGLLVEAFAVPETAELLLLLLEETGATMFPPLLESLSIFDHPGGGVAVVHIGRREEEQRQGFSMC
ncbi:MAG: hypothetical protein JXR83_02725 [Deltaproteobacteria bacterium]|nr:hypothetical protein [Deltaproteobacteria bacterium]